MPGDRETDEESQPGLPLSENCAAVSRQLYLWLAAPRPTVAGGHRGSPHRGMWLPLMSHGNTLVLPQTHSQGTVPDSPLQGGWGSSDSHGTPPPFPLFLSRHIMDLNMNAVTEKNYGGLSESLR